MLCVSVLRLTQLNSMFPAELVDQAVSEGYPAVETFYDLAMDGKVEAVAVYDPDVDDEEFQIDPEVKSVLSGNGISLETKKTIVDYWKSNVRKRKPLSSVQSRFRGAGLTQVRYFTCVHAPQNELDNNIIANLCYCL